jgi:hypothetical protein
MVPLLLLGAGFSHNWGGWLASEVFEYLLGDPQIKDNSFLRNLLWEHQHTGGFENALEELNQLLVRDPRFANDHNSLYAAVRRMFDAMNAGYRGKGLEFRKPFGHDHPMRDFLVRFKAVFSLNQDTLLEQIYLADKSNLIDSFAWRNWQIPGMALLPAPADKPIYPEATGLWILSNDHSISATEQPTFKLHGSSNWKTSSDQQMMIIGGGKAQAIARHPVLLWYAEEFKRHLGQPGARLMVIGYSFSDTHINDALQAAIATGLKLFIVDPLGADVASRQNKLQRSNLGYKPTPMEDAIRAGLIGASRRSISSTFGTDQIEHSKIMQFFE